MSDTTLKRPARLDRPLTVELHVLGAARDVTGSLNLIVVRQDGKMVNCGLLDVGLYQGDSQNNFQKRLPAGITPADISWIIISHAHIDHSGYLPYLVKAGFNGPVYCTAATRDLIEFLLPDSGHLQEMGASRARKQIRRLQRQMQSGEGGKKLRRSLELLQAESTALYGEKEAKACLKLVQPVKMNRTIEISPVVSMKLTEASHILGAAVVTLEFTVGDSKKTFCFTGNIGRPNMPILKPLAPVLECDVLMCESTYGNVLHDKRDRLETLAGIIRRGHKRALKRRHPKYGCGAIIIPAFAVGRVQSVLYDLRQLMAEGRIPNMPVYLDSPMAIRATAVHRKYRSLYNADARRLVKAGSDPFATPRYTECTEDKGAVLEGPLQEPVIIIGSSGMGTGGLILSHLRRRLPGRQNTVVFVGHQEPGTLGYDLVHSQGGQFTIFGKPIKVNATIEFMSDYSGHADWGDTLSWLRQFRRKPSETLLVHGEPEALDHLQKTISKELGWKVTIPSLRQRFILA